MNSTDTRSPSTRQRVPVAELFYSFQGEGPSLGRRALFLRLSGCNLTCGYPALPHGPGTTPSGAMVCDTEYTWNSALHDLSTARQLTLDDVWDELEALDPAAHQQKIPRVDLIVVSGGEPMMRQDFVAALACRARAQGRQVEIETNATITPRPALVALGVYFNAGLKLANSAVSYNRRIKSDAITAIQATGRARWKFVVTAPEDLDEVAALQHEFGLTDVWLSPEGTEPEDVIRQMRAVADHALARGWNLTTREHILIWGKKRGC